VVDKAGWAVLIKAGWVVVKMGAMVVEWVVEGMVMVKLDLDRIKSDSYTKRCTDLMVSF
jgi:hypothetical protein